MNPPALTLADQQRAFDAFRRVHGSGRMRPRAAPAGVQLRPVAAPLPQQIASPNTRRASPSGAFAATERSNGRGSACSSARR